MVAQTARFAKRVVIIIIFYEFEDPDQVSRLSFLEQLERACDCTGVYDDVAMLLLAFIKTYIWAGCLTIRMTLCKNLGVNIDRRRGVDGQERIYTSVKAVNHLRNAYTTDEIMAKTAVEIETFEKSRGLPVKNFAKASKH